MSDYGSDWDTRVGSSTGGTVSKGKWAYSPGAKKPWWMSQTRYDTEAARYQIQSAKSPTDWTNDWSNKYASQMQWMKDYLYSTGASGTTTMNTPQYTPVNWSDYEAQNQGYQSNMQSLMDRIKGGYSSTDIADAMNQVAQTYGMDSAQYKEMQDYFNVAPGSEEQLAQQQRNQEMAGQLATTNDEVYQKFKETIRSQQRIATADASKQLETIFADRGGLGAFSQAYEYTTQIADQALQQETQFITDRYSQALNQINADNDRKAVMIQQGTLDTQTFLKDRWNQLQTAYEDTVNASQLTLQEFTSRADVNNQNYQMELESFLKPIESMKDIMMTQLGIDQAAYTAYETWYNTNIQPYLDLLALDTTGR